MDGLSSFYPHSLGIDYMLNESNVAFMETGDSIRFYNKYPCEIQSIWKSPSPLYTYSMYMKKNSPLTPFIAHKIRKLTERGVSNVLNSRHRISKPNCKPILSKGKSLSLEKVASSFALFLFFICLSLLILVLEKLKFYYNFPQKMMSEGWCGSKPNITFRIERFLKEFKDKENEVEKYSTANDVEIKKALELLHECQNYLNSK